MTSHTFVEIQDEYDFMQAMGFDKVHDLLCVASFLDHRTLVDRCNAYIARHL